VFFVDVIHLLSTDNKKEPLESSFLFSSPATPLPLVVYTTFIPLYIVYCKFLQKYALIKANDQMLLMPKEQLKKPFPVWPDIARIEHKY